MIMSAMHALETAVDARHLLGTQLLADVDVLVDAVAGEQFYGVVHPIEVGEIAGSTRRIVGLIVRALVDDEPLSPQAERSLVSLGTRRAEQGIPLESVTAAFQRATSAGLEVMKQATREWPDRDAAMDAVVAMADALFLLVQAATALVRDGYEDWVRRAATGQAREDVSVVEDLFEGAWTDAQDMIERGRAAGLPLTDRGLLVVAAPLEGSGGLHLRDELLTLSLSAQGLVVGLLRGTPVTHVPGLVPVADETEMRAAESAVDAWARRAGVLVLVEPVADMARLSSTYESARDELPLALAVLGDARGVDRKRELHVARLLRSIPQEQAEAFIRPTLGGVLALPPATAARLLETLRALFAWQGSIKDLAGHLALSHSGLCSRLAKIGRLTARHHSRDRVELALALQLFRLHRLGLPPLGDPRWSATE